MVDVLSPEVLIDKVLIRVGINGNIGQIVKNYRIEKIQSKVIRDYRTKIVVSFYVNGFQGDHASCSCTFDDTNNDVNNSMKVNLLYCIKED